MRPRSFSFAAFLLTSIAVLVAVAVLWTVTPEDLRGVFLPGGMILTVVFVYGSIYVLEHRPHE